MKYDNPELLDSLAREYVLGTLVGLPRIRFEQIIKDNMLAQNRVTAWQEYFVSLNEELEPVTPPNSVWVRIQQALNFIQQDVVIPFWKQLAVWQGLAACLAIVAIVLSVLFFQEKPFTPVEQQIALMTNTEGDSLWLIQLYENEAVLQISSVGEVDLPADRVFELWMLPDGSNPVSLGILPINDRTQTKLSEAQLLALSNTSTLAISLEPTGGSPTGLPTGPVLFTAQLVKS